MKPLLPAIDAAGLLREAGFALLIRDREPIEVADLAEATGIDTGAARAAVIALAEAGWLDLDDAGRVTGAAGLSLATGPHRLTLGDFCRSWTVLARQRRGEHRRSRRATRACVSRHDLCCTAAIGYGKRLETGDYWNGRRRYHFRSEDCPAPGGL